MQHGDYARYDMILAADSFAKVRFWFGGSAL